MYPLVKLRELGYGIVLNGEGIRWEWLGSGPQPSGIADRYVNEIKERRTEALDFLRKQQMQIAEACDLIVLGGMASDLQKPDSAVPSWLEKEFTVEPAFAASALSIFPGIDIMAATWRPIVRGMSEDDERNFVEYFETLSRCSNGENTV